MKNTVKSIIIISIIVAFVSSFISCSVTTETNKGNVNSVEKHPAIKLRFLSGWGGVDTKTDGLQQILDKFIEDNPDIEVINESLFGDDFLPKLKTDFASGNDPDVFGIWPGSDIRALIKANKVAELTDLVNSDKGWKASFKESGWSYTTYNNKIFGLPLEIIFEGLFINKDLFEKYDIKVPDTFEELKNAVSAFKSRDVIPIAYNSFSQGTYLYQNIIAVLGGKEEVENPFRDRKMNLVLSQKTLLQ
jgi:raffinose/stachyose/melibiose transport system substrate-binding protein